MTQKDSYTHCAEKLLSVIHLYSVGSLLGDAELGPRLRKSGNTKVRGRASESEIKQADEP